MITISRDGQNYGPYSTEQIQSLVATGQLTHADLAWQDGETEWKPLTAIVQLGPPPLPAPQIPQAQDAEEVVFSEGGVQVTNRQILIGKTMFVVKNIGGVGVQKEKKSRGLPFIGFLIFVGPAIVSLVKMCTEKDGASFLPILIISGGITVWCAARAFAPETYMLMISVSGSLQRAFSSRNRRFVDRVAQAIQQVIV